MLDNQCIFFPQEFKSERKIASAGWSFVILIIIPLSKKALGKIITCHVFILVLLS